MTNLELTEQKLATLVRGTWRRNQNQHGDFSEARGGRVSFLARQILAGVVARVAAEIQHDEPMHKGVCLPTHVAWVEHGTIHSETKTQA